MPSEEIAYTPVHSFADFKFPEALQKNIVAKGYLDPTPIQDQAITHIQSGKDIVGIAQTGTGKTAAFLLPLLEKMLNNPTQKAVILVPTRELAVQIYEEGRSFAKGLGIKAALIVGGLNMHSQVRALHNNPQVIIATPGRLKELQQKQYLHLDEYSTVVLDEVDRMLDMGFIRDIRFLISLFPAIRQTLFFSATMPDDIRELIRSFVTEPVTVKIQATRSSDRVHQDVVYTQGKGKISVLHDLLLKADFKKVLLFGRTKHGIEKLSRELETRGFAVAAIHGNKRQSQRIRAINEFKDGRVQVLLATDVASRGLDIANVSHVINYDIPESYEDYIHRIGRTGRADSFGYALTFLD